jgi:EmrB/QacA subfamily drug resistance transporter
MLMPSLDTSIANAGLPILARAFCASFQAVQWIVLAYLLAITSLIVSVGRLGDLFGRRRLLVVGIGTFSVASLVCGIAPTLWLLIVARAAQGLGAALMLALTIALVGESVPRERTGSAMGLLGTMSALGTTLGPSLGGVLTSTLGWRSIFLINVPLGILNVLLALRHLPKDRSSALKAPRFDYLGTLLLALTLGAYALVLTLGHGRLGRLNATLLGVAMVGMGGFIAAERRAASPLIRLALFRASALSGSLGMSALVSTVMMSTLVVGPFYLSRGLGLNPAMVGMVMSVGPMISILSGVPAGRIVDRCGASVVVLIGLCEMTMGAIALSVLPATFGLLGYLAAIAVLTPGYQLFQAANNTAIMTDIAMDQRGVVSGMLSLSRNLGLITGASLMGAVFTFASASADIATAQATSIVGGLRITFAVATLLIVLALAVAIRTYMRSSAAKDEWASLS